VAILQLAQQGTVKLSDTVGTYLTGFATEIAEQVRIHHLLTHPGLSHPGYELQRNFRSREEVHEFYQQWTRQAKLEAAPGTGEGTAQAAVEIIAQIVEAVTGMLYWD
jgi:CubicO group peptidase (beta-lactamase class C family)